MRPGNELSTDWQRSAERWLPTTANFQRDGLKNLFTRYKTALPSSAAVERPFSVGKDLLKSKRAGISGDSF